MEFGGGYRKYTSAVLVCMLSTTLTACGDTAGANAPASSPASSASETTTLTSEPTPTEEPTSPTDTEAPPVDDPGGGESTAPILPPEAAGQPLTLDKFFHYPDGWKDGRFDVADRKQTPGIAGIVNLCSSGAFGETLELRLANNFKQLKLEAGQSNSSDNSDQTMLVRIDANGQYRDTKKVRLNQITPFQISVDHVNALKIIVALDQDVKQCGAGSVEAVLMNMVLS